VKDVLDSECVLGAENFPDGAAVNVQKKFMVNILLALKENQKCSS